MMVLDLADRKFKDLTVLNRVENDKYGNSQWLCLCVCGKKVIKTGSSLNSGKTKSCGCRRYIDRFENLVGRRFGKLVVKRYINMRGKDRIWECKCRCGGTAAVQGCHLRSGHTKSCGCYGHNQRIKGAKKKHTLRKGQSSFNYIYSNYKRNAARRGHEFNINKDDFKSLTSKNCFYCGAPPTSVRFRHSCSNGGYKYNGLDRVNNDKGYTIENVVPCCIVCNKAKSTQTFDEYKSWVIRLARNFLHIDL